MPEIVAVRWRPFRLELRAPAHAAHGTNSVREGLLIAVSDSEGRVGFGEASPMPSYAGGSVGECMAKIRSLVAGLSGLEVRDAWNRPLEPAAGVSGGTRAALLCGVETALADLVAKVDGVPVAALLAEGRPWTNPVPVNGLVDAPGAEGVVAEATSQIAAGFRVLKVKVGFEPDVDERRVAAIRNAVGTEMELRADANGAWDEVTASRMLGVLKGYGVTLVEQPLPASTSADAVARLRRDSGMRLGADEGCRTLEKFSALVAAGATDVVVIKPMVSGLRESLEIAEAARAAGVAAIATTTFDSGIGTMVASHFAAGLPTPLPACGLATHDRLVEDFVTGIPPVVRGTMTLDASRPGLGVGVDDTALERLATGPWEEVLR